MRAIDRKAFDQHFPMLAYEMGVHMMEHLRRVYREFDGDIAMCIVLGEIAHHSARPFVREIMPRLARGMREEGVDAICEASLRPCNAMSIAQASGIPRETVRRKVAKLEALGWVARDARGGLVYRRGTGESFREFNWRSLHELFDLVDRLRATLNQR